MRQRDEPLAAPPTGDRPNDEWMCGRSDSCESCARGPSTTGICGDTSTPCEPVLSWRGRARRLRVPIYLLGFGVLMCVMAGPWRREFFAPGPLATSHAQILSGDLRKDRCAACHPAARGSLAGWFGTAQVGHDGVEQTDLCLDCHHVRIPRERSRLAHNLTDAQLKLVASQLEAGSSTALWNQLSTIANRPGFSLDTVQCSVCHREHHGADADLNWLSNAQCQACHQQRFNSLADGHPEFGDWPYDRASSLEFNHAMHAKQHFVKQGQAFNCLQCHPSDSRGEFQRFVDYKTGCATCHDESLNAQSTDGFALTALPMIDMDSIADANIESVPWPEFATGVDSIQVTPVMRLLLLRGGFSAEDIDKLENPEEDIWADAPSEDRMRKMAAIAEATRNLMQLLAEDPQHVVESRLGSSQLVASLSRQLIKAAFERWFPTLQNEIAASDLTQLRFAGSILPMQDRSSGLVSNTADSGKWTTDDVTGSIVYRGGGHADPTLAALVELAHSPELNDSEQEALTKLPAVAACLKCHVATANAGQFRWLDAREDALLRDFTKFSHQPHLNIRQLVDCQSCHKIHDGEDRNRQVENVQWEFEPISRATCVQCHKPKAAGDDCVKCHRYHIGIAQ